MLWQRYYRPESVTEALQLLASARGRARLVAGATDLSIQLKRGEAELDALVDVTAIRDLGYVRLSGSKIEIGALVTHAQAAQSELLQERALLLAEACSQVGSPQIRNVGTIVGNIVNAQPAADSIVALMALEARLTVVSRAGERQLPISQVCLSPGRSVIDPCNEMVTQVEFEMPLADSGSSYQRLAQRQALSLPVVAVGTVVTVNAEERRFERARIAVGPVAPIPFRAEAAERSLQDAPLESGFIDEAAALAARDANPRDSLRGGAGYRKHMVEVLVRRSLLRALERAGFVDV